jgi:dCMP deaminase
LNDKWDRRFLELAKHVAAWSRDPRTQVGAVIVRPDKTIASIGFNGLPRLVVDAPARLFDRNIKHRMTIHAELNAILHAREPLTGYRLYVWPFQPCAQCAGAIIQAGISIVLTVLPEEVYEPWATDFAIARQMFIEAGVELITLGGVI